MISYIIFLSYYNLVSFSLVEQGFRSFTEVNVPIQGCKNTILQVKVLHEKFSLSKSTYINKNILVWSLWLI